MNIHLVGKRSSHMSAIANTPIEEVCLLDQVHGNTIVSSHDTVSTHSRCEGDAWQVETSGTFGVKLADCLGLVMWSTTNQFPVYVVHSGWRGTRARIAEKAVQCLLAKHPEKANVRVFLSPAAHSCCYEVGEEFLELFGEKYVNYRNQAFYFDNVRCNVDMLLEAGVLPENIETHPDCTICTNGWYSFRRDKTSRRNMLAVTV